MNGSKRTISRILAFVMLVSAMFTNVISASADVNDVSLIDSVVSSAAAAVEDIIDDGADDLAVDPSVKGDKLADSIFEVGSTLAIGEHTVDAGVITVYGNAASDGSQVWAVKDGDPSGDTITDDGVSVTYSHFVQGEGNPDPKYNSDGALVIPTSGAYITIKPSVKAKLTADVKVNGNNKYFAIMSVKDDDQTQKSQMAFVHTESNAPAQYKRYSLDVEPGYTYYMTGSGSKFGLYAIQLVAAEDDTTSTTVTEASTQATTATTQATTTKTEDDSQATTAAPTGGDGGSDLDTPEIGTPATVDIEAGLAAAGLAKDAPVSEFKSADNMFEFKSTAGAKVQGGGYGLAIKATDTFKVRVLGNADITLMLSSFAKEDAVFNVTDAEGNDQGSVSGYVAADKTTNTYEYRGPATVLTFTFASSGQGYLGAVTILNKETPKGEAKSFEFFIEDIQKPVAGAEGAEVKTAEPGDYTKVVTLNDGTSTVDLGDSVLSLIGNGTTKYTPEIAAGVDVSIGGREHISAYKAGGRHATPNSIPEIPKQGDGTAIVFTPAADGTFNTYFYSTSFLRVWDFITEDGSPADGNTADPTKRTNYVDSDVVTTASGADSYAFPAKYGHTYVLSTTGKTNNCAFIGFQYIVDEPVTVDINITDDGRAEGYQSAEVILTDEALGTEAARIKVSDGASQKVKLAEGHTYVLSTNDGGVGAKFNKTEDKFTVKGVGPYGIYLHDIPSVKLSGKFIGGSAADVKSVVFKSMVSGAEYPAKITEDGYELDIKPGEFNAIVTSDKYYTKDRASVLPGQDNTDDIFLESLVKSRYVLPEEIEAPNTNLTFNGVQPHQSDCVKASAGNSIIVPVNGKQKVTVAGWNSGTWDINGQNSVTAVGSNKADSPATNSYITNGTETEVTVNITGEATAYLYWITVEDVTNWDANKTVLEVPSAEFPTLKDAVAYIRNMEDRPAGEAGRMTIKLTKNVQEQIVFDAPYITLDGDGHEINWYYGQTGFYYSVDPGTGLYNESLFYDKYSKTEGNGTLWGGVAIIRGDYFLAENTTFRNTFNYEVTDKEIEDGAENRGNIKGIITKDTDVTAYNAKERANAFYIEAKNIEIYNCSILSNQDTFGRNGSANDGYSVYVKDSIIGGTADYICGEFAAVFDNCELQWYSYPSGDSNNAKIGYITAPKTNPYVFRNCNVTATRTAGNDPVTGTWGRTWGSNSNATFLNCVTNGHILDSGWGQMSSSDADPIFREYGNTVDGIIPFMSNGEFGKELEPERVAQYTSDDILKLFTEDGSWIPVHYEKYVAPELPFTGWGDVDNDGDVDATDATLTHSYVLSPSNIGATDAFYKERAEVSDNTVIDTEDVAIILQKALNSQYAMPVELAGKKAPVISDDDAPDPNKPEDSPTIWVVGDSTGCHYENTDKTYYYKRVGFGDKIKNYIYADVNNLALSGRSSSSFIEDPEYKTLTSQWAAGDYIIIAFGHNDEKKGDVRYTAPGGTKDDAGTFKNSLYVNYIKPALDNGVTPILCTPIVRRKTGDNWSDNNLHKANGGDYAQDIRDLAAELGLFCIDNTQMTKDLYDKLGVGTEAQLNKEAGVMSAEATGSAALHAANQLGVADNTHINNYGAKWVAYMMAKALKDAGANSPIDQKYLPDRTEPSERDLTNSINPDWVAPSSADPSGADLDSKFWKTTAPWHGSVFGNVGGQGKLQVIDPNNSNGYLDELNSTNGVQNFLIEENSDGTVHLRDGIPDSANPIGEGGTAFGKIEKASDGFTLYYQDVNSDNFEISGTITVNGYMIHSQTAFGAIILDTVNKADDCTSTTFPYVSAGIFRVNDIGAAKDDGTLNKGVTSFARIAGELTYGTNSRQLEQQLNVGDKIKVTVKKVGDTFTTTTQNLTAGTPAVVDTYVLPMEGTIYPGFYVARCADITISDISYTTEVVE